MASPRTGYFDALRGEVRRLLNELADKASTVANSLVFLQRCGELTGDKRAACDEAVAAAGQIAEKVRALVLLIG